MPEPVAVEEAVAAIRPDDRIGMPLGPGQPGGLLHAMNDRDDWTDLRVFGALLTDLYELFLKPGVTLYSGFYGPAERFLLAAGGRLEFIPADFRRLGPIAEWLDPRVAITVATPPDEDGYLSLSLHAGGTVDLFHWAGADPNKLLIVEANPNYPRTLGLPPAHPHTLHIDEIDILVESDRPPLILEDPEPTGVEHAIAEIAAGYIPEGATIQTGIGGVPTTVARILAARDGGGYGIHSEMFTTGLMHLCKAGKVTNTHKGIFDGYAISTFAAGTQELYDWLDGEGREQVRFLPVGVTNSPDIIAANRNFVSINGALSVDLFGQVVADTVRGGQFSGIGGHEDFLAGAGLELEDRSLLCLPSTAVVEGQRVSRIVAQHPAGALVTTPRHQVDVIITEHGAAELQGRTVRERIEALIAVADPECRDELEAGAKQLLSG